MRRRWVSLGGWCGPSLILSKLNMRDGHSMLPYDMVRCTLDGIVQFTSSGFAGYFPAATEPVDLGAPPLSKSSHSSGLRIPMDPVSIWLLFRGQHTAFTHYDLNDSRVMREFERRVLAWEAMVDHIAARRQQHPPVTFLRTIISADPRDEIRAAAKLLEAFDARSNTSDSRLVLVAHDQGAITRHVGTFCSGRISLWTLGFAVSVDGDGPASSLLDKCHEGYERIVRTTDDETFWKAGSLPPAPDDAVALCRAHEWQRREHLCRVEGVPTFKGTCTGFGSTMTECLGGVCLACGDASGHILSAADARRFDSGREFTEDEDAQLIGPLLNPDVDLVAHVEATAAEQRRSAGELHARIKTLFIS